MLHLPFLLYAAVNGRHHRKSDYGPVLLYLLAEPEPFEGERP